MGRIIKHGREKEKLESVQKKIKLDLNVYGCGKQLGGMYKKIINRCGKIRDLDITLIR